MTKLHKFCQNWGKIKKGYLIKINLSKLLCESTFEWESINIQKCMYPAGNYMIKVNNRNTRKRWEICSKLPIKIPEWRPVLSENVRNQTFPKGVLRHFGVFLINFEYISHLVWVFLLLTFNSYMKAGQNLVKHPWWSFFETIVNGF